MNQNYQNQEKKESNYNDFQDTETISNEFSQNKNIEEKVTFKVKNKQSKKNTEKKTFEKKTGRLGWKLLISGIIGIFLFCSVNFNSSDLAQDALNQGFSTQLEIGTILSQTDDFETKSKDYTIKHSSNKEETTIWVWDYASEDGDYVQILHDGKPISSEFMIKNKAIQFTVPTTGEIQVLGIRDGGGGITYAIRYELNGTTYFNGTNTGTSNIYTLILEETP